MKTNFHIQRHSYKVIWSGILEVDGELTVEVRFRIQILCTASNDG